MPLTLAERSATLAVAKGAGFGCERAALSAATFSRLLSMWRSTKSGDEIMFGDLAACDPLTIPIPRHGDGDCADTSQPSAGIGQLLVCLAEKRIDCNV